MLERITSRDNQNIKEIGKLLQSAKHRRETGRFVLEGTRLCHDAVLSGVTVEKFFYTKSALEKYGDAIGEILKKAQTCYEIDEALLSKISDTKSPQGALCVCRRLDKTTPVDKMNSKGRYVGLENIQDPSNLGAVLRTAEALGVDGVILSKGCCDLYSPKVLRGSMGAVFRLRFHQSESMPKTVSALRERGFAVYASVPESSALPVTKATLSQGAVILIGNEGNGLTKETIDAASAKITIPMLGRAESLNASAAAGILMWEMMR